MSKPTQFLFLDEGGDLSFSPKGSKYFTMTCVSCIRPFLWDAAITDLRYDMIEQGEEVHYFHASENPNPMRKRVFDEIAKHLASIRIDSIIVEKNKTHPKVQADTRFYPEVLGYLLKYVFSYSDVEQADNAVVFTDHIPLNRKRKAIEGIVKRTLKQMLPESTPYRIYHHKSASAVGLQLADYVNWAIYKKWTTGDCYYYDKIKPAISSEFDLLREETARFY